MRLVKFASLALAILSRGVSLLQTFPVKLAPMGVATECSTVTNCVEVFNLCLP